MLLLMKNKYFPIYIIAGVNLFTLLMYMSAPYIFYDGNVVASYFYILLNIFLLVMGFKRGVILGEVKCLNKSYLYRTKEIKVFRFITAFYFLTFLIKYAYLLKFSPFDISGMIGRLLIGIADPKLGYRLSIDSTNSGTISWSLFFLTSIFNGIYFIAGFLVWPRLSIAIKIIFLLFVGIEVFYWVGRGTNFGVISLAVTFLLANLINNKGNVNFSILIKYLAIFIFSILSFSLIMYSRSGGAVEDLQIFSFPMSYVDESSFLLAITPKNIHTSIMSIFFYVVQGYYNMSIAFDLNFIPTWFGGSNSSIASLYTSIGFDVMGNSYINRLEVKGIDPKVNWHSAYTWIANDFSFIGVPLIIYVIGFFMGFSWVKSIISNDFYSKLIFILFAGFAIFIFANNNFIGYYFYSFMFIFPYWIYKSFFVIGSRKRG